MGEPPGDDPPVDQKPQQGEPWAPKWPLLQTKVEHYRVWFDDTHAGTVFDLAQGDVYVPGTFSARGEVHPVELRQRGDGARYHPKHSWKVKLPDEQTFDGARTLNFLAEYLDGGLLTDVFAYRLMAAAGVPAPRPRYVSLTSRNKDPSLPREVWGLYTLLENVDKYFLEAHGFDNDANVYRCGSKDCELKLWPRAPYQKDFEKKTNEEDPSRDDLNAFLHGLSRTPEHELEAWLEANLELDGYLRYMAVNALIANYGIDDSGTFLFRDVDDGKWRIVPWDLNNARMLFWISEPLDAEPRSRTPIPVYTAYDTETIDTYEWKYQKYEVQLGQGPVHRPFSVLNQRIYDRPGLRNRMLDHLEHLLDTVFTQESAGAQVDKLHGLLEALYANDPFVDLPHAQRAPAFLKEFVKDRIAFLRREIPKERQRGEGGVVINAIGGPGVLRDDHGEADGYVELYNREDTPTSLDGLVFTDELRREFKHRLPSGLVVPPRGKLVLWMDGQVGQGATHLPFRVSETGGELGLLGGRMADVRDLTYYAPIRNGQEYRRVPDGAETWRWSRR